MNILKEWVSNIFVTIVVITFVEILLPDSSIGKYVKFVFALLIMTVIIYPAVNLLKAY